MQQTRARMSENAEHRRVAGSPEGVGIGRAQGPLPDTLCGARKHAIARRTRRQSDLLASPHAGRGQILVQAGLKDDVVSIEVLLRRP